MEQDYKAKLERQRNDKLEKQRLEREQLEKKRLEALEHKQADNQQPFVEQSAIIKGNNNLNRADVSNIDDNNYGYPNVHNAFIAYVEEKKVNCTNPTHLVLYAKKRGLNGVGYSKVVKYFQAQKSK
eukprot:UN09937